jgi:hypothetical protein
VPLPSTAAVVYDAIFIETGTRTGVSILYVSDPRCSKRCPQTRHQISESFYIERNANLELDGQYRGEPLDRESFVGLLRDLATFLTGPILNCDVLRLRKPVSTALS